MTSDQKQPSRKKTLIVFILTIIIGFVLFALPNLFFGISKINDRLIGVNLLLIALFQLTTVSLLIYFSLKVLKTDFKYIGLSFKNWKKDSALGLLIGLIWTGLQFGLIIPNSGGIDRQDILQIVSMMDGSIIGLLSFIALGVIGGGITEEIYNRGYFIIILKDTFINPQKGLWISAIISVLFFAIGHLPTDAIGWIDIIIPTLSYTILFLYTKKLTASIVAHGIYNMSAIILTYLMYYV